MKQKHLDSWIDLCLSLAKNSNCPRAKFGAVIVDPEHNTVVSTGYNGSLRGAGDLCGGSECLRTKLEIESGTLQEIGCVHAEQNAIINVARTGGNKTDGCWMFINGEPCKQCIKWVVQSGIVKLFVIRDVYPKNGLCDLGEEIEVEYVIR